MNYLLLPEILNQISKWKGSESVELCKINEIKKLVLEYIHL